MRKSTLRFKSLLAFLSVGLVSLALGIINFNSLSAVIEAQKAKEQALSLSADLLEKEIAHLKYRTKMGEFQRDPNQTELNIEKDAHKCGFGQWYYSSARTEAEAVISALRGPLEAIEGPHSRLHASSQEIEGLLKAGKRAEAIVLLGTRASVELYEIQNQLGGMRAEIKKYTAEVTARTDSAIRARKLLSAGVTVIAVLLAMSIGYLFSNMIERHLRGIASRLTGGALTLTATSDDVANNSETLSSATEEQAAALQETAASVTELSSMIAKTAENAQKSREVANGSSKSAKEGKEIVGQMITSIMEITDSNQAIMTQIQTSNQEISKIVGLIKEIDLKTQVINDIVFQTKLLSFNASVEAARAGEHGKGFSVVAEEVGNLARMSGSAAQQISTMLENSTREVHGIVERSKSEIEKLAQTSSEKVQAGAATAMACGEAFDHVVSDIEELTRMAGEIEVAATEQSTGINEINKAMGQLDQVTHQNAKLSNESSAAAQKLKSEASVLREHVGVLEAVLDGAK
ncbi:MAG TPA: hypothetical protein DCS07_16460 [Bdellovibrionales bacterium]|nr:MAG: hypothetical protein A2Z97_15800 [Bdellovibrionales bacterium GWB1_52_6]OFZ06424.1 MAG: hypothetical protein A2X97_03115 [Bdellovibrionales bacterium GWA1_52_35]OFZ40053.1 MAG: hypothetical protein A2070_02455 [Bdellovibrionales bacterium GWC1_52_8]HAR44198.1 hypothetical protein [Bdellovibrionales bacterium]HCM40183.1 hypothetical protein [Bdellovibrionales bacterium]